VIPDTLDHATQGELQRYKNKRSGVEDLGWSHRSSTRWPAIERSGGAMCGLHLARGDQEREFLG
jgi:hypothetical protein